MIRSCRGAAMPRRIVIAAVAALIPLIAGCDAGTNAPSLQWHQPTDGAGATFGGITISNAFVLGAPLGSELRPGQNAGVFFGLANTGTSFDRLISISAQVKQQNGKLVTLARSVLLPGGRVTVNSQHSVLLTGPRPQVILEHLLRPVPGGSVVTLKLSFQKAGQLTLKVPVMPMAQYYSTFSPPPAPTSTTTPAPITSLVTPTATPTATISSRPHHKHHRSPSPSPSASP